MRREAPASPEQAAEVMRSIASEGLSLRPVGGGTKLGWGRPLDAVDAEVSTASLDGLVEHNAADLTAIVRAGLSLEAAQEAFAEAGQMLALDPPLGAGGSGGRRPRTPDPREGAEDAATIGGIVASGDSGPLRHRYGSARDLLLGIQVALADGTLARSGGKVIKNVAGYDLAKLFTGSFGTLGLIVELVVRLHPLPKDRVTAVCRSADARALQATAVAAAAAPLELESLDLEWSGDEGRVLARLGGASAAPRAEEVRRIAGEAGVDADVEADDEALWDDQRRRQRVEGGATVRVSALATDLARVVGCTRRMGADVVGRAGLGLFWVRLAPVEAGELARAIEQLRAELSPHPCVVQDAPAEVRAKVDVWGVAESPELDLMRRVKARFDPAHVCNPDIFVGGI